MFLNNIQQKQWLTYHGRDGAAFIILFRFSSYSPLHERIRYMQKQALTQVGSTMPVELHQRMMDLFRARRQSFRGWLIQKVEEELRDEADRQAWEEQHEQGAVLAQ